MNILLVDDRFTTRSIFHRTVTSASYHCVATVNDDACIRRMSSGRFLLAVLYLRGRDWESLATLERAAMLAPKLRFIVIADALDDYAEGVVRDAPNVYKVVRQPVRMDEVIGAIDDYALRALSQRTKRRRARQGAQRQARVVRQRRMMQRQRASAF